MYRLRHCSVMLCSFYMFVRLLSYYACSIFSNYWLTLCVISFHDVGLDPQHTLRYISQTKLFLYLYIQPSYYCILNRLSCYLLFWKLSLYCIFIVDFILNEFSLGEFGFLFISSSLQVMFSVSLTCSFLPCTDIILPIFFAMQIWITKIINQCFIDPAEFQIMLGEPPCFQRIFIYFSV